MTDTEEEKLMIETYPANADGLTVWCPTCKEWFEYPDCKCGYIPGMENNNQNESITDNSGW